MKRLTWVALCVALTSSAAVGASEKPAGTGDPLARLDSFTGSWIWRGRINRHGEDPQDFVWRYDSERILDGRFFLEREYDLTARGKLAHLSVVGWSEEEKVIKSWGFWAPPSSPYEEVVYEKTDDGWHITREGLDGKLTVVNDDEWKYEADFEKDGTTNHWGFTARRLKSPSEADAKKVLDTVIGRWALTFEEGGQHKTATFTATPSSSKLALRVTFEQPGEEPANGMLAWAAAKKQIVETWFRGGENVRICFDGIDDDGTLTGPSEGMLRGKQFAGLRVLKYHSADHYTHTIRENTTDGEPLPEVTIVGRRIGSKQSE